MYLIYWLSRIVWGRILKIILYGSYARGGWVDEPHTAKGYQSDYDLLIIVNDDRLTDRVEYWAKAEERLIRELSITKTLRTPVNFIVHSLHEVNDGLAHGRYFFMDVKAEGIALYQSDDSELHTPKPKTPEQALAMAKEYFEEWFPAARKLLRRLLSIQSGEGRLEGGRLRTASGHRAALSLRPAGLHLLHAARPQSRLPAHAGRADRPAAGPCLAARTRGRIGRGSRS